MESLINIQASLKAPKGQTNTFGKYKYRSCEDILTALKPLLKENNSLLTISDEILLIGDRYYVKATATISCDGTKESVSAYARESLDKKGMDVAQITGAASSYARKYALNGMFAIDDTKDADTFDNKSKQATPATNKPESEQQQKLKGPANHPQNVAMWVKWMSDNTKKGCTAEQLAQAFETRVTVKKASFSEEDYAELLDYKNDLAKEIQQKGDK